MYQDIPQETMTLGDILELTHTARGTVPTKQRAEGGNIHQQRKGLRKVTVETKTETTAKGKPPSHIVYFVPHRDNAPWTRIGAQWPIKNGKGYRQDLDMVPLGWGNIIVLPNEPKSDNPSEEGA